MDRKIINESECVLCNQGVESVLNVLWACTVVKFFFENLLAVLTA